MKADLPLPVIREQPHDTGGAVKVPEYEATVWPLADGRAIDFRYRLADGRLLCEVPAFWCTAREYLTVLRDPRFNFRLSDNDLLQSARSLFAILHAVSLRGIYDIRFLTKAIVADIAWDTRLALETLLHVSPRLEAKLKSYDNANPVPTIGGKGNTILVDRERIVRECNLPTGCSQHRSASKVINDAARRCGMSIPNSRAIRPMPQKANIATIEKFLTVFERLHVISRFMPSGGISFKPLDEGAHALAVKLGIASRQTRLAPPRIVIEFFKSTVRFVQERRNATIDEYLQVLAGANGGVGDGQFKLAERIRDIAAACFVIQAGVTGRRYSEVLSSLSDCVDGDESTGWWYRFKPSKGDGDTIWMPVPRLFEWAVATMIAISAPARARSGDESLFQFIDPCSGEIRRLRVNKRLNAFARLVAVPQYRLATGGMATWRWTPHQFRRFFAVVFFHGYDGDLEVLAYGLQHFDLNSARGYAKLDPEIQAIWHVEEQLFLRDFARAIVTEDPRYKGGLVTFLSKVRNRLKNIFRKTVKVIDPDRETEALHQFVRKLGVVVTPRRWIKCFCPNSKIGAKRASCRRKDEAGKAIGPDWARASTDVCAECPWGVSTESTRLHVSLERAGLQAAVDNGQRSGTIFGELEREGLVALTRVCRRNEQGGKA